jgi:glutamate-5-semialdehyde dehydrogenase
MLNSGYCKINGMSSVQVRDGIMRQAALAKQASRLVAQLTADKKKRILKAMADSIESAAADIVFHNEIDVEAAKDAGLAQALVERLVLDTSRVQGMAQALREISDQKDPIGEVIESWTRPAGFKIDKVRVPLGVVAMIYESRPNVTVDAAALCLQSGNAVILRGGSEAINSNRAIMNALMKAAVAEGLPEGSIQLIADSSRDSVTELIQLPAFVDLVIARGSEEMILSIMKNATVPVLGHGKGVCHVYVDDKADLAMAEKIAVNAKVQRPGVCNAMETLLVHESVAKNFLPKIAAAFAKAGVEMRGEEATRMIVPAAKPATEDDWFAEYLDLIVAIRVVPSVTAAVQHINRYGSGHSDAIVTQDQAHAEEFLKTVDSAAVLHNASTRLHDGSVFGLGAEIGISTRKLHARGTMGARELTTTKYVVRGTGQIRE